MTPALNYQLLRLSALLQLEQRARGVGARELAFMMVNDTASVVPYQQAVLQVEEQGGTPRIVLSGVAQADEGGPYRLWLDRLIASVRKAHDPAKCTALDPQALPEAIVAEWSEWLPANVLCCPLIWRGTRLGMLLFARPEPWLDGDMQLMETLSQAYAHSLMLAVLGDRFKPRRRWRPRQRVVFAAAIALIILVGLLPLRISVLAPAEIVPVDPAPVRAPFDGVVGSLHVTPNQAVHAGQILVSLDRDQLMARYAVAQKALDMAQAEYMVAAQQAMSSAKDSGQIAVLASKVDQQRAELVYDRAMLDRANLTAPTDGIAVFDDVNQWIGKPVSTGERIMLVASPKDTQLEIQVPASEIVTFATGSDVVFFDNIDPDRPTDGKLTFASYSSAMTADGVLAYAFRAKLDPNQAGGQRLGLKGTAKIYGPRRPLALWLLRRPIAVMREWLSL